MIETNQNTNQNPKIQNSKRSNRRNNLKGMNSATATALLAATALSYGITATEAFILPSQTHQVPFTQPGQSRAIPLVNINSSHHRTAFRAGSSIHADSGGTALFVKKERRSESRYGVRRRVRSVLARAKNRTGIQNRTDYLDKDIRKDDERKANSKMNISDIESSSFESFTFAAESVTSVSASASEPKIEIESASVSAPVSNLNGQKQEETSTFPPAEEPLSKPIAQVDGESTASATPQREAISTAPRSKTIDRDSSINVIAEAASIGGLGPVDFDYRPDVSTAPSSTNNKKKSKPASTYSVTNDLMPAPGDDLIPSEKLTELDFLKGDVSAAFSMPAPPLPFTLPELTQEQRDLLRSGERIEFQSDMGREGSGFVVMDVKAPSAVVWECLLDFYSYPNTIPTVRDVQMFTNTHLKQDIYSEEAVERQKYEDGTLALLKHGVPSVTRAAFTLSKFRLKIAAIHKYRPHPRGDYMVFTLDPACTNVVLKNAKGVWHTQSNPDGQGDEYTRVWLLCELSVSPLLPQWITDYAARRAMPRATTWVKPHVEAAAELWFKGLKD